MTYGAPVYLGVRIQCYTELYEYYTFSVYSSRKSTRECTCLYKECPLRTGGKRDAVHHSTAQGICPTQEMASTGLERGDPSSSHEIPQMVVAATVPKGDPHHLLAEEQAAAATLSSLMPYVSASSGTSQPSWVRRGTARAH